MTASRSPTPTQRSSPALPVLQVVLSLNPGGTERLVLDLVKGLHTAGCPMAICCLDEPGAWAAEAQALGVVVEALGRQPGFHPGLGRRIAEAARRHGAAVIHAHHYTPFVYAALARLTRSRTGLVFTEHGRVSNTPPSGKRRLANSVFFRRMPHRVFAVSHELRAYMLQEGFTPHDVGVIHNGIALGPVPAEAERAAVRSRLGLAPDVPVIGTIARLDPVKDLGSLLDATARLRRTDAHVLVIGDGPERAPLEDRARTLGLGPRAHFLGRRDDARWWLAGMDVYVNCSRSEGVSLTILEAMAASLPVVVTRVGGTPEVVTEACGRLVPAETPEALAHALEAVLADRSLQEALGRAGRQRVEADFTLDRMIASYESAYRAVASEVG